jgi:hypothetical protein
MDFMRYDLEDRLDYSDEYAEFCWFAREYPRVYRHHIDNVEFRLEQLHRLYSHFHAAFQKQLASVSTETFELSVGERRAKQIYWEFEALLNAVSAALDVLTRVIGLHYKQQMPPSFNGLAKDKVAGPPAALLRSERDRWVRKFKDYRDCFVHYTCVDTLLAVVCREYKKGFEVRCKLPNNPNERDILGFKYDRRSEVLKYAIATYKNLMSLDKKAAQLVRRAYLDGSYPARSSHLFFIGRRVRD